MATRNKVISVFLLMLAVFFAVFKTGRYANSANETPTPLAGQALPTPDICTSHDGVNCTVFNSDASVVCNDGTIDKFPTIYAVPQCQKAIQDLASQQSNFMASSGCSPPGEMACINQQSYKNLSKQLTDSGLIGSELGKDELTQCDRQISDYQQKNNDYKQCLIKNGDPNFVPIGKIAEPILKAIFCPIFYGDNASYDSNADLCICDAGYFMSNEKCTDASLICQSKYGPNTLAQNGNCSCQKGYHFNGNRTQCVILGQPSIKPPSTPVPTTKTPVPKMTASPDPVKPNLYPAYSVLPSPMEQTSSSGSSPNFLTKIFNAIVAGIKNILRL